MNSNNSSNIANLLPAGVSADDFVTKDILDLMGASKLNNEEKAKLYDKMMESIEIRVITRIYKMLSAEDQGAWDKLASENHQLEMAEFLKERDIDLAKIFAEEAMFYKAEMINLAKKVNNNQPQAPKE